MPRPALLAKCDVSEDCSTLRNREVQSPSLGKQQAALVAQQCVIRAYPKHARLDSGQESTLAIPYAVLFQLQACSPPEELYERGRALSSWETKESPMAPA
ncbi:hypothetical protein TNCV_4694971 [Trichonephila clavipes]|nr:hypothetical protein TNCV_4694971 [Trichonephila clavipes]